ncbi:DUF2934 domain-containing protein [Rhizobium sp. P38BS-XIX]|uniref:DUF2934 domain-containing protein n=1 Tax=Rhizobium sp. P38BS-XIX TaxID=2726740 RepID=UPI0019811D8F
MINDDERRLRAYQIWEREGRPEGRDAAHWHEAGQAGPGEFQEYRTYSPGLAPTGSIVIKFYRSGDQIRGYVRRIADAAEDDAIFPGEEMEPDAAFKLAGSHRGEGSAVFIELTEGVDWDPAWGPKEPAVPSETDDARSSDGRAADRRRQDLADDASNGIKNALNDKADPVRKRRQNPRAH